MTKPIVYGSEISPPTRAVMLTLRALDIDYDFIEVNPHDEVSAQKLRPSGMKTVPMLEDDGKYITDSHAIAAYLVRKYGKDDSLYPKDFYQRAVVDQRLHYENGVFFMTCIRQQLAPIFKGTVPKEQIAEKFKAVFDVYTTLENFLGDHPYIAGSNLTIADFSILSTVTSVDAVKSVSASDYPKLAAWLERLRQLPYYEEANGKGALAINNMFKEKMALLK